jgi:hypothetical protein
VSRFLHEKQTDLEPDFKGVSLRAEDKARSRGLEGAARLMMMISAKEKMYLHAIAE